MEKALVPSLILILQHAVLTDVCFNQQKGEFMMMGVQFTKKRLMTMLSNPILQLSPLGNHFPAAPAEYSSLSSEANTLIFLFFGLVCFLYCLCAHMAFSSLILPCGTQLEALPPKLPPTGMVKVGHKAARVRQNIGRV